MMSTEHEQIVQRGFDAFETADMDAFTADWAPGRARRAPITAMHRPRSGQCRRHCTLPASLPGGAGIPPCAAGWHEKGRVLVLYTEWRRDPGETEPKPVEMAIIHTIEDGQVRHMQVHTSHESARRVAGVQ